MKDYYTVLDLEPNATDEQIRTQYRQLVRIYHPDRFSNPADKIYAERKLQDINEAYYGLLAPERTGKAQNRRLTEDDEKYPLLKLSPSSMMVLLSVLFVGVFLGGVNYDTLLTDDPNLNQRTFGERILDSLRGGNDADASSPPKHEWLSFSVFENYRNVLYVVDSTGQPQMTVEQSGHSPVWSPDRNMLAFLSLGRDGTQIYVQSAIATRREAARSREGNSGQATRITQDNDTKRNVTWSPDGLKLAYIAYTNDVTNSVLKLVDLQTNQITALTSPKMGIVGDAVWLDNETILATLIDGSVSQIHQIFVNGQATEPFVSFPGQDPSVAPSGQRVALAGDEGIFTLLSNGNDVSQLTTDHAWNPVWSPSGSQIAYLAYGAQNSAGEDNLSTTLWIMDSDGENQRQLTGDETLAFAWSVDGTSLAYVTGNPLTQPPTLYLWAVTLDEKSRLMAEISEPHVAWGRGL